MPRKAREGIRFLGTEVVKCPWVLGIEPRWSVKVAGLLTAEPSSPGLHSKLLQKKISSQPKVSFT